MYWTIYILVVSSVILLAFLWNSRKAEHFAASAGTIPTPTQLSTISRDVAKSTTANPDLAKPDMRDWAEARDAFRLFLDAYGMAAQEGRIHDSDANPKAISQMLRIAPLALEDIEKFIAKPETLPSRDILTVAERAKLLANLLRRPGSSKPFPAEGMRQQAKLNAS